RPGPRAPDRAAAAPAPVARERVQRPPAPVEEDPAVVGGADGDRRRGRGAPERKCRREAEEERGRAHAISLARLVADRKPGPSGLTAAGGKLGAVTEPRGPLRTTPRRTSP